MSSFIDEVDLEAQVPYSDDPEFDKLAEQIAVGLFDVNSQIVTGQGLVKSLNREDTNQRNRRQHDIKTEERAVQVVDSTREAFKHIGEQVRRLQLWDVSSHSMSSNRTHANRFTQQKLKREFETALVEFQQLQRELARRQREAIVWARTNVAVLDEQEHNLEQELDDSNQPFSSNHRVDNDGGMSSAQIQQLQEQEQLNRAEVAYQQQLIEEREDEIQAIEQGIQELHEIFTDLGTIVAEQGTIVDNIEANMYSVAGSTQEASTQLTKASRYQRRARGRALCLFIILAVILAVVLLGIIA